MSKRESLGKRTRFDIFKRDAFTCQYCGRRATDVVLQVDHIKPVCDGGGSDRDNLITSCTDCNSGKGGRPLTSTETVAAKRKQLEGLESRREQLAMMCDWEKELRQMREDELNELVTMWNAYTPGLHLNEAGRQGLRQVRVRFSIAEVIAAIPIAAETYLKYDGGSVTSSSVSLALGKLGGICFVRSREEEDPHAKRMYYIKAIVRSRCDYFVEHRANRDIQDALHDGVSPSDLEEAAKSIRNWTEWQEALWHLQEAASNAAST